MEDLEPKILWDYFFKICQIPRPTHYEEKIQEFIIQEALKFNLDYKKDDFGNILITKTGSFGYELSPVLALQAHLDMVAEKEPNSKHNFLTDPIKTKLSPDGLFLEAEKTTLGADNGIGVAAALAVLASNVPHPPLEVLFTASEEVGMRGATNLNKNWLSAEKLLNLDSEVLGEICIGCAGGLDCKAIFPLDWQENQNSHFSISIKGLSGGHSGIDIDKNRGNAIKIVSELLLSISDCAFLVDFKAGNLRNAICREAELIFASNALWADLRVRLKEKFNQIKAELCDEDKNVKMEFKRREEIIANQALTAECSEKILKVISDFPHGVLDMSADFKGVVENSNNLAKVEILGTELVLSALMRSLNDDGILKTAEKIAKTTQSIGGKALFSNPYPSWEPEHSQFLIDVESAGIEIGIKEIKKIVIHAGLECGLIFEKYPRLEMVSIGPNIFNPHSPSEKVEIKSVEKFWSWLLRILLNS